MAHLAAYFGCARGPRHGRRLTIHITAAGECDRLAVQQLPLRFALDFALDLGTRARLSGRRRGRGLSVMGLRYTPWQASQFTHVVLSIALPALREVASVCRMSAVLRCAHFQCNRCSQKKSPV